MTVTATPLRTDEPRGARRRPLWRFAGIAAAVLAAAGIGAGLALSLSGASTTTFSPASSYSFYQSMMGRYQGMGSMMGGGSHGSIMGGSGYHWMMGGSAAPGWMSGGSLPGFMMGSSTDPGKVMGALLTDAPGPRVTAEEATALGNQVPAGAVIDRSANRISFSQREVTLAVLASPAGGPDETFRIAGLVNPTVVVPRGAKVSIQVINADPDTAHGLVVTPSGAASTWMPMMSASPAFPGSALWFLGNPTAAGMHVGTLRFTASDGGAYQYLCAVPGHAQKGMVGRFIITG